MQIKEIMTTDIISVSKNEDLQHVMDLMKKHDISKVPVLDGGQLVGIVTDNVIADKLGSLRSRGVPASHLHASTVTDKNFESIYPQMEVREILATVGRPGLTMLPVLENHVLVGVVTKADLLPFVTVDRPVGDIMTGAVHTVKPEDRVVHARHLLFTHDIARLPVVEDGRVQGILSDMEIAFAFAHIKRSIPLGQQNHRLRELLVSDVMKKPALVVGRERTAGEAAAVMLDSNVGCLPVVDGHETLAGIVTRTDLVRLLNTA
ncbi:MAG: CBS domain-containing protein [Candidatus Thermoplasmatota archaeon]|nr:CBS domain-containing protein [Candidatus Thermoplasmatota archaeon]